jgi:hypothetical protein
VKFLLVLFAAALCLAQNHDFLTPNEVAQIREAQDPNDRLTLYVHFARMRMDLIEQYLAKEKPGRSVFIHDNLEDFSQIIEAMDSVADDALRHSRAIDKGMLLLLDAEKEFLDKLTKIQESDPKDLDRYKFVLTEAIDTTSDSRELSMEDSAKRTAELAAQDSKEKKARDAMMPAKEVKDRKQAAQTEDDKKKKTPSLYRPGEKPQNPN